MNDAAVWEESGTGALFSNKVGRRSPVMGGWEEQEDRLQMLKHVTCSKSELIL